MTNASDPIFDQNGEITPDPLYLEVGKALSQWETLETNIALIFSLLVSGSGRNIAAEKAYGSIAAGTARIEMIKEVAEVASIFYPINEKADLKKRLLQLCNEVARFSARRNDIAHGVVTHWSDESTQPVYFLMPAWYNSKRHVGAFPPIAKYRYRSETIAFFRCNFERLTSDAIQIAKEAILFYVEKPMQVVGAHTITFTKAPTDLD